MAINAANWIFSVGRMGLWSHFLVGNMVLVELTLTISNNPQVPWGLSEEMETQHRSDARIVLTLGASVLTGNSAAFSVSVVSIGTILSRPGLLLASDSQMRRGSSAFL